MSTMHAITIGREYGSGGGEIARRLAEKVGWSLLDNQVVARIAQRLGISVSEAEIHDEHVESFVQRLLESMQYAAPNGPVIPPQDIQPEVSDEIYFDALCHVLETAAELGNVVIVGRGSQMILRDRRDVLRVLIVPPLDKRIAYVMQRENLSEAAARERIQHKEHERTHAFKELHHSDPQDTHLYDLVINTGVLDLQSVVDLILLALERKGQRLAVPESELGPGAGLQPYPGRPDDLPDYSA